MNGPKIPKKSVYGKQVEKLSSEWDEEDIKKNMRIRRPSSSSLSFRQPPPQLLGALLCLSSSSSLSCFSSFTLLYSLFTEEIKEGRPQKTSCSRGSSSSSFSSIILETDPNVIAGKVASKSLDFASSLSEQI
ncbi:coatomer subunit zeta-2-like isoform X2 [Senna tora]|uniref:Coatomer subunit zeta-2-like isoform X2 n=1 Tax=Senna tora TaxID=362788 RepID=A0A834WN06_9FABA|nr:coatomer subunit zeta-2-like isoform X2 [Senna tora]